MNTSVCLASACARARARVRDDTEAAPGRPGAVAVLDLSVGGRIAARRGELAAGPVDVPAAMAAVAEEMRRAGVKVLARGRGGLKDVWRRDTKEGHERRDTKEGHERRDTKEGHERRDTKEGHERRDTKVGHEGGGTRKASPCRGRRWGRGEWARCGGAGGAGAGVWGCGCGGAGRVTCRYMDMCSLHV
jgi:hypothetical protein